LCAIIVELLISCPLRCFNCAKKAFYSKDYVRLTAEYCLPKDVLQAHMCTVQINVAFDFDTFILQ